MSLRYEIPSNDPDEIRRQDEAQRAEWKALAAEVTDSDPKFQRWKRRLWIITGVGSLAVFSLMMYWAISFYDPDQHYQARAHPYSVPFIAAGLVIAAGSYVYSRKIRSIGLAVWSRRRDEEFRKEKS